MMNIIDKINIVKKERQAVIAFMEKKLRASASMSPERTESPKAQTAEELAAAEARRAAALIELVSVYYSSVNCFVLFGD